MIDNKFNIGDKVVLREFLGYFVVKGIQVDEANILLYIVGSNSALAPFTTYNALEAELKEYKKPIKPVLNKFNLNDLVTIDAHAPNLYGTVFYVHAILQVCDKSRAYYSVKSCEENGKIHYRVREEDMEVYVKNHA